MRNSAPFFFLLASLIGVKRSTAAAAVNLISPFSSDRCCSTVGVPMDRLVWPEHRHGSLDHPAFVAHRLDQRLCRGRVRIVGQDFGCRRTNWRRVIFSNRPDGTPSESGKRNETDPMLKPSSPIFFGSCSSDACEGIRPFPPFRCPFRTS